MADEIIPGADLPRATPGVYDSVVGVDESTGALRRFPVPVAGSPTAYATLADLPASAADGTPALVTNDSTAANNGLYRYDLATTAWVKAADRVSGLEADVSDLEAKWDNRAGKRNAWPDPFFRHVTVGADLFDRQRWRALGNDGFASLSLVANNAPFDGNLLRVTNTSAANNRGPVIWLDEIDATAGDTITIYALITGPGALAKMDARFFTAANIATGSAISGASIIGVDATGELQIPNTSSAPQWLRCSGVVPADAVAVVINPNSTVLGTTLDVHAVWGFKGGADDGPAWPTFSEEEYLELLAASQAASATALTSRVTAVEGRATALEALRAPDQLATLKAALVNPLHQFVGIVLIGDSITWGMTVTGGATVDPRTHSLTDARNNANSPSWANLLHAYLGRDFYEDEAVAASAWAGSPSGVAVFEYSKTLDLSPIYDPFSYANGFGGGSAGVWTEGYNSGSTLGYYLNATTTSPSDDLSLTFTMTGYEFDVAFAALPAGAVYELFVDGVSQGTFSTQAGDLGVATSFGNTRNHAFGSFKRDAEIEIRLVAGDAARVTLRIEAIRVARKLRLTNQGIVGTNVDEYVEDLIGTALQDGDQFAFIQLGTNDRNQPASGSGNAESLNALYRNLARLLDAPEMDGIEPILLCANAVEDNAKPTYKFDMSDVRAEIRRLANDRRIDFIDQFAITRNLIGSATTFLADGLHPNDYGHNLMFENIKGRIDSA